MACSSEIKEKLSRDLVAQQKSERDTQIIQNAEKKAEAAPFLRHCFTQQRELDILQKLHDKQTTIAYNTAQIHRTENLAYEMRQLNGEEFCNMKLRQQLHENCPELRELGRQLNAAYANKIVQEQIKEKKARKLKEKILELEQADVLAKAHVPEKEYFRQMKEKEILQQNKYKQELQDQMIFQENAKRTKYEEFLKEKKLIDALVLRIQEEEERDMQMKYCAKLKTQDDIRKFKESQALWRAKARERVEKEDLAIQEFIKKKMEQGKKIAEEKEAREVARAELCDKIAKDMYIEKRKQAEKDEILAELLEAEERESHERAHREKVEKDFRTRLEIYRTLNCQMEERLELMRKEAERDAKYKEELIAQQVENERLEQLSNEKRRLRMMQLRRDVEERVNAERLKKTLELQLKIKEQELAREEAEKRRLWIEDERVRMIKEHAENLIGFLPMHIMSDSEVAKLGDDLKLKLNCNMNVDLK